MSDPLHQGERVAITISDPWEFGTACGTGPFHGVIADASHEKVLVVFDQPIQYANALLNAAICKPRHTETLTTIPQDTALAINVSLLATRARELMKVTREEFRDGCAAIGSLYAA